MATSCAMVLTTIHDSRILEDYRANFERYGHLDRVQVIVIPDRKTPPGVFERCRDLASRGLHVDCPDLQEQDSFLGRLGGFGRLVPYDSDNRRNVGYLMALERGCDFLISIDDDNFCLPDEDFIAGHEVVCEEPRERSLVEAEKGWLNVCGLLELEPKQRVYARGYPYCQRHGEEAVRLVEGTGAIRLNAGLWLGEPDLDGMTWLTAPVRATGSKGPGVVLGHDTWSPINTQNTALERSVVPSYYCLPMGAALGGLRIDRFGDIFGGYFARACLRHLGDLVSFGRPLVEHRRNAHEFLVDATQELGAVWILEDLTAGLCLAELEGTTYAETYLSLSHFLDEITERFSGFIWTDDTRAYLHRMADSMRAWIRACTLLDGAGRHG